MSYSNNGQKNFSIAAVYTGAHPAHVLMGDTIGAKPFYIANHAKKGQNAAINLLKLVSSSLAMPSNYDFILTESCYYYPALKRRFGVLGKTKIINMVMSPIFYDLFTGRVKGQTGKLLLELARETDAHLITGAYGEQVYKKINIRRPYEVIYPFILENRHSELLRIKNNLDSRTISIIAGNDPYTKGLDLVLKAFKEAYSWDNSLKLEILSDIDPTQAINLASVDKTEKFLSNVRFIPKTDNICGFFDRSSLYLQPSRGETFSVASLEAMASGVPVITSTETGVKEVVEKVSPNFVVPLDKGDLSNQIISYFSLPLAERQKLGGEFRKLSNQFNQKDMLALFAKQFSDSIKRVQST